jgi:hypothetical protein
LFPTPEIAEGLAISHRWRRANNNGLANHALGEHIFDFDAFVQSLMV